MDVTETREWRSAAQQAARDSAEQRRMILEFPDLAAKLCQPPLGYKQPEQWTGYIPPRWDATSEDNVVKPNDSPRRAALLALLEQAAERWDRGERAPAPMPMPVLQQAPEPAGANA